MKIRLLHNLALLGLVALPVTAADAGRRNEHRSAAFQISVVQLPQKTVNDSVRGEVVDPSGAPVGGSIVQLVDSETQKAVASQIASESGEFQFQHLPLGEHYRLEIRKDGFDPLWVPLKVLHHGGAKHLRLALVIAT